MKGSEETKCGRYKRTKLHLELIIFNIQYQYDGIPVICLFIREMNEELPNTTTMYVIVGKYKGKGTVTHYMSVHVYGM